MIIISLDIERGCNVIIYETESFKIFVFLLCVVCYIDRSCTTYMTKYGQTIRNVNTHYLTLITYEIIM